MFFIVYAEVDISGRTLEFDPFGLADMFEVDRCVLVSIFFRFAQECLSLIVIPLHHEADADVVLDRRVVPLGFQLLQGGFVIAGRHMFHRFIDQRDSDVFGTVGIDPGRAAVLVGDRRRDGSRPFKCNTNLIEETDDDIFEEIDNIRFMRFFRVDPNIKQKPSRLTINASSKYCRIDKKIDTKQYVPYNLLHCFMEDYVNKDCSWNLFDFGYHIETDYGIFSMQGNNITNQINTHIN